MRVDVNDRTIELGRQGAGALADIAFNLSENPDEICSLSLQRFGQAVLAKLGPEYAARNDLVVLELTAPHALSLAQAIRVWTGQPDDTILEEYAWLAEPQDPDDELPHMEVLHHGLGQEALRPDIADALRGSFQAAARAIEEVGLDMLLNE